MGTMTVLMAVMKETVLPRLQAHARLTSLAVPTTGAFRTLGSVTQIMIAVTALMKPTVVRNCWDIHVFFLVSSCDIHFIFHTVS